MAAMRFLAACFGAVALALRGSYERDEPQDRPVSKVITLLQDLQKTLETEQDDDEASYNKMACQCESGTKELDHSIEVAKSTIETLTEDVRALGTESARLTEEVTGLEGEVTIFEESLAEATALREKETALFRDEQTSTLETVSALKAAIIVLEKHHQSFLQQPSPPLARTAAVLRNQLHLNAKVFYGVLTPSQRVTLSTFVAVQLGEAPTPTVASYEAKSGEIFGILKQLLEQFQNDLTMAKTDEEQKQSGFEAIKIPKGEQIKVATREMAAKRSRIAEADTSKVAKSGTLADTRLSLAADESTASALKEDCGLTDQQWEERQAARQTEMTAVAQALQLLADDDAHDTFTRTFTPSFFQAAANRNPDARERAAMVLSRTAKRVNSPALSALAAQTKMNDFTDVKEALDRMVAQLQQEMEVEVQHKDQCIADIHENDLGTAKQGGTKDDVSARINTLESDIASTATDVADLEKEIKTLQSDLTKAGESRELRNKEFQEIIKDQVNTQKLLTDANEFLKKYYAPTLLAQAQKHGRQHATSASLRQSPEGFEDHKANQAGHGIIAMLDQIIQNAKSLENMARQDEALQQSAYEAFVKATNDDIDVKTKSITHLNGQKDGKNNDRVGATAELASTEEALKLLSRTAGDLHLSCDFIVKNFELRQTARTEEITAIGEAKAILSGASFDDAN